MRFFRQFKRNLALVIGILCTFSVVTFMQRLAWQQSSMTFAPAVVRAATFQDRRQERTSLARATPNSTVTPLPGIDKKALNFILEPKGICSDPKLFLVTYVHTSPLHFSRRMAVRNTWGNPNNMPEMRTRVIFVVGRVNSTSAERMLAAENSRYGDVLQGDFIDSYKNLTYKGVTALRWISEQCPTIPFVLKSDDDIMVNVFQLLRHLKNKKKYRVRDKRLILCLVWYNMKVIRDKKNKWYVSPQLWSRDTFPTYCSGSAFVLSGDMIADMYQTALKVPFFWVDDLYVTGLLVDKLGVTHESMHSTYIMDGRFKEHFGSSNFTSKIFGVNIGGASNMYSIWKVMLSTVKKIQDGETLS